MSKLQETARWALRGSLVTAFMTPERWQQIEKLYHAALEHEGDQRTTFLYLSQ